MPAFKRWIVERARPPEMLVTGLALSNQVKANQLRCCVQLHGKAATGVSSTGTPLPVTVVARAAPVGPARQPPVAVEIETADVTVRVRDGVAATTLRMVLACERHCAVIGLPANTRVWIVAGHTHMRKRFDGLAALAQRALLAANPFCSHVFGFRGMRGVCRWPPHLDGAPTTVSPRRTHLDDGRGGQVDATGRQRCGGNSSMRLAGCSGSRSSTSWMYA